MTMSKLAKKFLQASKCCFPHGPFCGRLRWLYNKKKWGWQILCTPAQHFCLGCVPVNESDD